MERGITACAALAAAGLLLLALVATSAAESLSRDDYVSRLESICKPGALATQRVMKGARADVRAEKLVLAASKFAKGSGIFDATVDRMAAVPRPAADKDRLSRWFTYLHRQERYLRLVTDRLREGAAIRAQRSITRFIHNGNLANYTVLAFGFSYCSFKFSRYG